VGLDVEGFVRDGYVAVRGAFDAATAAACREDGSDPSQVARAIVTGLMLAEQA
jgi:hypothetical protein